MFRETSATTAVRTGTTRGKTESNVTQVCYGKNERSLMLPDHIFLGTLRDRRLRVQSPIAVRTTKENQHVIAEATELDEFGFGANLSEALRDLQRAIVELYLTLEEGKDRLSPDLQRVWATLQTKLLRQP